MSRKEPNHCHCEGAPHLCKSAGRPWQSPSKVLTQIEIASSLLSVAPRNDSGILKKLIVILGPTASGKSKWAEILARKFDGEIVSADSRQIYRGMDIGTAKSDGCSRHPEASAASRRIPWNEEGPRATTNNHGIAASLPRCPLTGSGNIGVAPRNDKTIPCYLIDIINPDEEFSLAQYKKLAIKTIKDIQKRGKIPFLVGGTGLYIQAVVDNLKIPVVKADKKLRKKLEKKTNAQLLAHLKKLDPQTAKAIDANNKRRLIRALEVCLATGKPFSAQRIKGKPFFDILQIGIKVPREELYQKIDRRVEKMIKIGLVEEVKELVEKYCSVSCHPEPRPAKLAEVKHPGKLLTFLPMARDSSPLGYASRLRMTSALSGIGYQEIIQYLAGQISLNQAKELIKQHTRQYARRQITWFKRDPRIHWVSQCQQAEKLVKEFLAK